MKAKNEFNIARQILRSGTSIGANVEEAIGAYSRKDFLHKMTIAYKEARETNYWIRLLTDTGYLKETCSRPLLADVDELLKILGSIQITTKRKQGSKLQ